MIRTLKKADVDRVAAIWFDSNRKAHNFIPAQYWQSKFDAVKELFLQAELYVFEEEKTIQGFIGLNGTYIEGLFVCEKVQSQGIGTCLLNYVKKRKKELRLSVYQKNIRAIRFYLREGFEIQQEHTDEHTGEKEYEMTWKQNKNFPPIHCF